MKVFLSSTYLDLIEHRKAVVQALRTMDEEVGHMEVFGARDEEATTVSLEELDKCDVLVGIYAYRYGTIPKGSKTSVTEEEYLRAMSKKIPILVFVVNEGYDWLSIKDESLVKIEKFKSKATRKHTPAYFSTPDNLAVQVVASIGRLEKKKSISELSENIQRQFDKAQQLFDDADYQASANLYGEVARLANSAQDVERERKALHMAVRALDTFFVYSHQDERERKGILKQINDHLQVLESLAIDSDTLGVDKARLALLSNKSQEALQIAGKVLESASAGSVRWVDALLTCIQAYWQLEKIDDALGMKDLVRKGLSKKVESHARIGMAATWLRTQIRGGKVTRRDILRFSKLVRELKNAKNIGAKKAMMIVGEVAVESNHKTLHEHTLALLEFAFELGEEVAEPAMVSSAALQVAEVAIYANESSKVNLFLGKAGEWVEKAKLNKYSREDYPYLWQTLRANWLAAKGRILVTMVERLLITGEEAEEALSQALIILEEGRQFGVENRSFLQGSVDLFLAELNYWSGFAAFNLNWHDKAVEYFRAVRSESAMAHPRFSAEMGMRAWLVEAEALALSGQTNKAIGVVGSLLQDERSRVNLQTRAEEFRDYLQNRINPVVEWFNSSEAKTISHLAKTTSLRDAIKDQMLPLISWWTKWSKEFGESDAQSCFFDFWGRGGFSRVAAAIRAKPHQVIAVDAVSVDEIRKWVRIFCPLFDTVLVKWKGALGSGMVLTPMDIKYGGPGSFGGHGYIVTAGTSIGENFAPALAWANLLPEEISVFLATEALPLIQSGRLVVLPAPLVGCTQSAVGWTDNLLLDGFLGGVVDTALRLPISYNHEYKNHQRVLDLSKISIPYIDNISLNDLAYTLEDTEEFVPHLRKLLLNSILSNNIKYEQWEGIRSLENDIQGACRELDIHLASLSSKKQWHIAKTDGVFSVASRNETRIGQEPISNLLSSLTQTQDQLAPWVPYWRMKGLGGYLDWSHPIDNPSKPPQQQPNMPKEIHSWLYPGTGGWGFLTVAVPE